MPREIRVTIGLDGKVELDMATSGLSAREKTELRDRLAVDLKGEVTDEKHKPMTAKEEEHLRSRR